MTLDIIVGDKITDKSPKTQPTEKKPVAKTAWIEIDEAFGDGVEKGRWGAVAHLAIGMSYMGADPQTRAELRALSSEIDRKKQYSPLGTIFYGLGYVCGKVT